MLSGGVQEIALSRDAGGERWSTLLTGRKSCLYQPGLNLSGDVADGPRRPHFSVYFGVTVPFKAISAEDDPTSIWNAPGSAFQTSC